MKKRILLFIFFFLFVLTGCVENNPLPPEKLVITGLTEVQVGKTIQLFVNSSSAMNWYSSDDQIASVYNGIVYGVAEGSVTITAEKATNIALVATYEITVILEEEPNEPTELVYLKTKILTISESGKNIELLNCPATRYDDDTKFIQKEEGYLTYISVHDLYIGLDNVYVAYDPTTFLIKAILLDEEIGFENIRVAIRKSISDIANTATLYHSSISILVPTATAVQTFDGEEKVNISAGSSVQIAVRVGKISISVDSNIILETTKRVIFHPESGEITVTSITRGSNFNPSYAGNLEVSLVSLKLLLINDVSLENYLTKVVPSEMPSSFHFEALKAQAVAARTYAYMDILNKSQDMYGYTVDDSVKSQVYNNQSTNSTTTQAVVATAGMIMTHDDIPVQAYYYSTSSGLTASAHEVWITTGIIEPILYLIGQNLAKDTSGNPVPFDPTDEASMLTFFKTIRMDTPDTSASLHRWKLTMNASQLANTLNVNLPISYTSTPESILTLEGENWVSKAIPSDIGTVQDVAVNLRGTSGVVIELVITTSSGTYKIINQYNIRFTIRPRDAGSTVTKYTARNSSTDYTGSSTNDSVLNSGFFAIEKEGDNYTFYGGGNGHGVGMSQYGANGLGNAGKTYQEILTTYYSDIDLTDITFHYVALAEVKTLFDLIFATQD
ncbi:MAG: SpoIID/LytB domain-containing protein [Bacilli bacterium]|jgi:SpoIID/LytB domain protein|nr:SpoIID/LytB domain-containing protein [Bacilli bacterium]